MEKREYSESEKAKLFDALTQGAAGTRDLAASLKSVAEDRPRPSVLKSFEMISNSLNELEVQLKDLTCRLEPYLSKDVQPTATLVTQMDEKDSPAVNGAIGHSNRINELRAWVYSLNCRFQP